MTSANNGGWGHSKRWEQWATCTTTAASTFYAGLYSALHVFCLLQPSQPLFIVSFADIRIFQVMKLWLQLVMWLAQGFTTNKLGSISWGADTCYHS